MPQGIFEHDSIRELPLWGRVLCAARAARRYVLALPADRPREVRALLLSACDAAETCVRAGACGGRERDVMADGQEARGGASVEAAAEIVGWMADAAHAAHDALDFGAAEGACTNSAMNAIVLAGSKAKLVGMTPLQFSILAASDVDQLLFVCGERRVGTYGALDNEVFARITPVHAPDRLEPTEQHPMHDDPTGGAR